MVDVEVPSAVIALLVVAFGYFILFWLLFLSLLVECCCLFRPPSPLPLPVFDIGSKLLGFYLLLYSTISLSISPNLD